MRIQRRRCRRKVEYLVFGANKSTPDDHDEMRLSTSATQFRVWFRNESIFLLIIDPSKNISPFSSTVIEIFASWLKNEFDNRF